MYGKDYHFTFFDSLFCTIGPVSVNKKRGHQKKKKRPLAQEVIFSSVSKNCASLTQLHLQYERLSFQFFDSVFSRIEAVSVNPKNKQSPKNGFLSKKSVFSDLIQNQNSLTQLHLQYKSLSFQNFGSVSDQTRSVSVK